MLICCHCCIIRHILYTECMYYRKTPTILSSSLKFNLKRSTFNVRSALQVKLVEAGGWHADSGSMYCHESRLQ
jgi:hypothetical protein